MARNKKYVLTEAQRRMYASEKLVNFRWISKILATYSPHTLTASDLASLELYTTLAELGQYAEVAYSAIPTEFIFENITILSKPEFPLEGYHAMENAVLVSAFHGTVAHLPGYIAYRPQKKQLILAFSGTSSAMHAFYDLRALKHRHPSRHGYVHTGFWRLYRGIKPQALEGIQKGLREHDVSELVITGHSMGGAVSYLLMLDLLRENTLPAHVKLQIIVYGAPRSGDRELCKYWRELVRSRREAHGESSITEYSVKTYNDGVPSLPPLTFGYRHYADAPLYFVHGRLYHVPPSESEYALFVVAPNDKESGAAPEHPRGGHNYYNGRDMERFARRIGWLDKALTKKGTHSWEEEYRAIAHKHHR